MGNGFRNSVPPFLRVFLSERSARKAAQPKDFREAPGRVTLPTRAAVSLRRTRFAFASSPTGMFPIGIRLAGDGISTHI